MSERGPVGFPSPLERAARALTDPALQPPRDARGCPPGERWSELVAGATTGAERDALLDHLATCPDCAAEVRALRQLQGWAREATAALAPQPRRRPLVPLLVAASVALAALSTVCLIALLQQRARVTAVASERNDLARELDAAGSERAALGRRAAEAEARRAASERAAAALGRPRLNVPILDLEPRDVVRGERAPAPAVARSAGSVTLLLHPRRRTTGPYLVELLAPTGARLWLERGLVEAPDGSLTLSLPTADLPAGVLRLRLSRERAGTAVAVDEFSLRLEER
jgi:hypothetical protein